jgi:hypothetical protein
LTDEREERYGPDWETVVGMLDACDNLTTRQLETMAQAYEDRGIDTAQNAWFAAERNSAATFAGNAAWDLSLAVKLLGFDVDPEVIRAAAFAATDAGIASATKHLIGKNGYTSFDHDRLKMPWNEGITYG